LTWGGTAIGHGGFYGPGRSGGPGVDTIVEEHEHIHPEQMEVSMLYGFIVQLSFVIIFLARGMEPFWVLHTTFWTISWMLIYSLSAFQAYLRGEENAYLGNIFEESAYAQTTSCEDKEEK